MASSDAEKQPPATHGEVPTAAQRQRPRQGWRWTILFQVLGILWLGPMLALLVLNFKEYVTGASVGYAGFCNQDLDVATLQRLQERDRDILGALQFVAKVLEVWFAFVASSFVYDLTVLLAVSSDGLPLRQLMAHVEYADLRYLGCLFSKSFWQPDRPGEGGGALKARRAFTLYSFLAITIALCAVVNLMGPAVAVLLLPTVRTREISGPRNNTYFTGIRSDGPPTDLWQCQKTDLDAGRYDCTSTDNFIDKLVYPREANSNANVWEQGPVWFTPNQTGGDAISWQPNRQALLAIEADFFNYYIARASSTYAEYLQDSSQAWERLPQGEPVLEHQYRMLRDSLKTVVRRKGPSIGSYSHCKRKLVTIRIDEDKEVHCYSIPTKAKTDNGTEYASTEIQSGIVANVPSDDAGTVVTKCARIGSGWGSSSPMRARFFFNGEGDTSNPGKYSADVYSVDQSIYLTPDNANCARDGGGSKCDWDKMFSDAPANLKNTSLNVQLTEYNAKGEKPLVCETLSFLTFPTYQIEFPLYSTTGFGIALLTDINRDLTVPPVRIHPDWMLAAISVDRSTTVRDGRKYPSFLAQALQSTPEDDSTRHLSVETILKSTMNEALSLIDYSTTTTQPEPGSDNSPRPLQQVSTEVQVWAYGFESRTSKLGAVVALMGCVVALVRTCTGLKLRTITSSPMMLVVTALGQREEVKLGELDESEIGKKRFFFIEGTDKRWPRYHLLG